MTCGRWTFDRVDENRVDGGLDRVEAVGLAEGVDVHEALLVDFDLYRIDAVRRVAQRAGVEMPICEQVYRVVYEGVSPKDAVKELMSRALKPE